MDTGGLSKPLTMTFRRGHADQTFVSPIPVPQFSLPVSYLCKLFIERYGAPEVSETSKS